MWSETSEPPPGPRAQSHGGLLHPSLPSHMACQAAGWQYPGLPHTCAIDPGWEAICQGTFPGSYLFSSSISQVQGETQSVRTAKAQMQVELLLPVTWPCSPGLRLTAPVSPPAAFSQMLMGLL